MTAQRHQEASGTLVKFKRTLVNVEKSAPVKFPKSLGLATMHVRKSREKLPYMAEIGQLYNNLRLEQLPGNQ